MKHSRWIWLSIGATFLGAISALYDKILLTRFQPIEVQGWYSLYQSIIMAATVAVIRAGRKTMKPEGFSWRWSIPFIALFLTVADLAYFYSLSIPGSMVAVVSMIRRGSVVVSFLYGVFALHEKNIKPKLIDLGILIVSLFLLILGSDS